jgi:hypothetical protein
VVLCSLVTDGGSRRTAPKTVAAPRWLTPRFRQLLASLSSSDEVARPLIGPPCREVGTRQRDLKAHMPNGHSCEAVCSTSRKGSGGEPSELNLCAPQRWNSKLHNKNLSGAMQNARDCLTEFKIRPVIHVEAGGGGWCPGLHCAQRGMRATSPAHAAAPINHFSKRALKC